jgi:hypothetical protein
MWLPSKDTLERTANIHYIRSEWHKYGNLKPAFGGFVPANGILVAFGTMGSCRLRPHGQSQDTAANHHQPGLDALLQENEQSGHA